MLQCGAGALARVPLILFLTYGFKLLLVGRDRRVRELIFDH